MLLPSSDVTHSSRFNFRLNRWDCFQEGVFLLRMTERVKSWVMAFLVVFLLEFIRGRHLGIGSQLLCYALAIFSASFVLYWLPPRDRGILRPWLAFSFGISVFGAVFLLLARR